jgi:hypothetical protein
MLDRSDGNHKLIARIFGWLFSLSRSTPDSAGRITTTGKSCFPLPSATASVGVSRGGMDMPRGFGVTQIFPILESLPKPSQRQMFSVDSERVGRMASRGYQHSPRSGAPHFTRSENTSKDASRSR